METFAFLSSFLFLSSLCPDEALTLPSLTRAPRKWTEGTGKSQDTASRQKQEQVLTDLWCGVSSCAVYVLCAWAIMCMCALYMGRGWSGYRVLSMVCACVMSISGALCDICWAGVQILHAFVVGVRGSFACVVYMPLVWCVGCIMC